MSSDWRECSLGDLIEIKHGYAFPGEHISKTESKCVLVTPGNFEIGGGYKEGNAKYFHSEYPQEYVFTSGDLVVTMTDLSKTADTLGYSAKYPVKRARHIFTINVSERFPPNRLKRNSTTFIG